MKIDQIYIDMDGVLVDWFGGVCDLLGRNQALAIRDYPKGNYQLEEMFNISSERLWSLVNRQGIDWWAHLEPLPHLVGLLDLFAESSAQISVLTSPGICEYSATGKFRWIKQHMPQFVERLYLCRDKHLLAKENTLLIDDHDGNCRRFIESGGQAIIFPQPWNEKHICRNRPIEYLRSQAELRGIIS